MKPETKFSQALIDEFKWQLDGVLPLQICRIESNLTEQGIPDLYLCIDGRSIWIELKMDNNSLSPFQKAWHKRHREAKGRSFIVSCHATEFVVMKGGIVASTVSNVVVGHPSIYEVVKYILRQVEEDAATAGGYDRG